MSEVNSGKRKGELVLTSRQMWLDALDDKAGSDPTKLWFRELAAGMYNGVAPPRLQQVHCIIGIHSLVEWFLRCWADKQYMQASGAGLSKVIGAALHICSNVFMLSLVPSL